MPSRVRRVAIRLSSLVLRSLVVGLLLVAQSARPAGKEDADSVTLPGRVLRPQYLVAIRLDVRRQGRGSHELPPYEVHDEISSGQRLAHLTSSLAMADLILSSSDLRAP